MAAPRGAALDEAAASEAAPSCRARRRRKTPSGVAPPPPAPPQHPPPPVAFRKVLYEAQPFPDNHTDETFLAQLVLNRHVRKRSYGFCVRAAAPVAEQLSVAVGAAVVGAALRAGDLSPRTLLLADGALLALGATLRGLCASAAAPPRVGFSGAQPPPRRFSRLGAAAAALAPAREAAALAACVASLVPLLHTLTSNVAADTCACCCGACLVVHLYLAEYRKDADVASTLPGSLSLGAALFGAVILASRLPSQLSAFALLCFALYVFLAWPFLRRDLARAFPTCLAAGRGVLHVAVCSAVGSRHGAAAACGHAASVFFVSFAAPAALVGSHGARQRINGPWDEARVELRHAHAGLEQ